MTRTANVGTRARVFPTPKPRRAQAMPTIQEVVVSPVILRLCLGAAGAALAGFGAWRMGWLDSTGAWVAAVVGLAVFGGVGWPGALALLGFFVTSSLLGRLPGRPGGRTHRARSFRQVLANGAVAALAALVYAGGGGGRALAAVIGALAAANADTWATELGTRSRATPRHLWFGRPVAAGASGGATAQGVLGSVAGALVIALCGLTAGVAWWVAGVAGLVGSATDTLAGGTVQGLYRCPSCGRLVEDVRHGCPGDPIRVRGFRHLDNDAVNLLATIVGAAVGAAFGRV